MSLVLTVLLSLVQLATLIVVYYALSIGLAMYLPSFIVGYDGLSALGDTQAVLIIFLLWDRFYGPYSHLLRGVAKKLKKAKKAKHYD